MTEKSVFACQSLCRKLGFVAFAFSVLTLASPGRVFAALGGDAASVQADQVHMQASLRSARTTAYTVQELRSPAGVVVRQYVSPSGTVFGVAWEGPWLPDMRQLLGSYFEQYEQAMQAQNSARGGRRPIHIEIPGLIVHLSGHPRSFVGQAYVPDMVPAGMRAEEIR